MDLLTALKTIKYPDIVNLISQNPRDQSKLRMVKNLYRYEQTKHNRPEHIITAGFLLALRQTKGKIPAANYIHKTIETNFQMMNTPEEAVQVLESRVRFELERSQSAEYLKKMAEKENQEPPDDPYENIQRLNVENNQRLKVESNVGRLVKNKAF